MSTELRYVVEYQNVDGLKHKSRFTSARHALNWTRRLTAEGFRWSAHKMVGDVQIDMTPSDLKKDAEKKVG